MIDGKPRIGDEVYIHGYIDEIRNDVVIIRNKGGYFGTSDREMFYYEEDERGYGTMNEADRKTENNSEKPNNCEYAENPSGDVWECGCFLDTYCEHQIYDRNPDGTINIVECGYEPKTEPTISKMEQVDEPTGYNLSPVEDEPQTERSSE